MKKRSMPSHLPHNFDDMVLAALKCYNRNKIAAVEAKKLRYGPLSNIGSRDIAMALRRLERRKLVLTVCSTPRYVSWVAASLMEQENVW